MNPTAELLIPEVRELIQEGAYSQLREVLHELPFADVADIFGLLEPAEAAVGFRFMLRDDAAAVFSYLPTELQESLIRELGAEASVRIVEAMTPDDRVRLIDELPTEVAQRIVGSLSPENRKITQAILGYPPGTVGRLMTPDYIRIKPDWSCGKAMEHVRKYGRDAETINVVYVVDDHGQLIDDLRLRQILLADPSTGVEGLMNRNFMALQADQPQGDAVAMMKRYDRVALPVVDSRGALLGIVTHDDVADVAEQQATEQMQRLGGVQALDSPYIDTGHAQMYAKRGPWLALLLVGQTITILVLGGFQDTIDRAKILTFFLPMVISCGGNSGSQAATLITRALAVGEIRTCDWLRIVRKELVSGLLLGGTLCSLGLAAVLFFTGIGYIQTTHPVRVSVTVSIAALVIVVWAVVLGSTLPLFLRRAGLDPATASSPMVATLMDASGTLIYLGVALLILTGTLL